MRLRYGLSEDFKDVPRLNYILIFAESLSSRSAELSDVVNVNFSHGSHYLPYQGKISISKPIVLVGRLVWLVKIPEKTFPKCSYDTIPPWKIFACYDCRGEASVSRSTQQVL